MFIKDLTVENFNWTDNDYKAVHEHRLFIKSRIWDNDFSEVTTAADTIWLLPKTTLLAKGDAPGEYIINDDIVTPDILPDCIFKITGYSGVKFKRSNGKLLAVLQGAAPWPATVSASYWVYDGMYKKIDIALNSESSPQVPTPPEFLFDATDKTYKLALSHLYRIPRTPETGDDGKFLMATGGQLTWAPVVNKTVTSDGTIIVNTDESTYYLSLNQNQFLNSLSIGSGSNSYTLPTAPPIAPAPGQIYCLSFGSSDGGAPRNVSWVSPAEILNAWMAGQFSSVKIGTSAANYQLPTTMPSASGLSYLTFNNGAPGWGSMQIATGNSVFQSGNGITVNQTIAPGGGNVFEFDLNESVQFTNLTIGTAGNSYQLPSTPAPYSVMFMITDEYKNPQWRGIRTCDGLMTTLDDNLTIEFDPSKPVTEMNVVKLNIYKNPGIINLIDSESYTLPPPFEGADPTGRFLGLNSGSVLGWRQIGAGSNIIVNPTDSGLTIGLTNSVTLPGNIIISGQTVRLGSYTLPAPTGTYAAGRYLKYIGNGECSWALAPSGGGSADPVTVVGTPSQIQVSDIEGGYKISLPDLIELSDENNDRSVKIDSGGFYCLNNVTNTECGIDNKESSFAIIETTESVSNNIILISKNMVKFGNYTLPNPTSAIPPGVNTYLKHVANGECVWAPVDGGSGSITVSGTAGQIISSGTASGYAVGLAPDITGINSITLNSASNGPGASELILSNDRIVKKMNDVEVLFTPASRYAPIEEARRINGISLIMPIDPRYVSVAEVTVNEANTNPPDLLYALTPDLDSIYMFTMEDSNSDIIAETDYMFIVSNGKCAVISSNGLAFAAGYKLTYYTYVGNSLLHGSREPQFSVDNVDGINLESLVYGTSNKDPISISSTVCGISNTVYKIPSQPRTDGIYAPEYSTQKILLTYSAGVFTVQEPAFKYGPYNLSGCMGLIDTTPAPVGADFKLYDTAGGICGTLAVQGVNSTDNIIPANLITEPTSIVEEGTYYINFLIDKAQFLTFSNVIYGSNNTCSPNDFGSNSVQIGGLAVLGFNNFVTGSYSAVMGIANVIDGSQNLAVGIANSIKGSGSVAAGLSNILNNSGDVACGSLNAVSVYKNSLILDGTYLMNDYNDIINDVFYTDDDPAVYETKIYKPFNLTLNVTYDSPNSKIILSPPDGSTFYIKTILSALNPIYVYDTNPGATETLIPLIPETGFSHDAELDITYASGSANNTKYDAYKNAIILTVAPDTLISSARISGYYLTKYIEYTNSAIVGKSNLIDFESANVIGTRNKVVFDEPYGPVRENLQDKGSHFIAGNDNIINTPIEHNNIIIGCENNLNSCSGTALINCNQMTVNNLSNNTFIGFKTTPAAMPPNNFVAVPNLQIYGSLNESWQSVTPAPGGDMYSLLSFDIQNLYIISPSINTLSIPPQEGGYVVGWKLTVRLRGPLKGSQFTITSGLNTTIDIYSSATQSAGAAFYTTYTEYGHFILNSPIITIIAIGPDALLCEN